MHLTQVVTTVVWSPVEDYPRTLQQFEARFSTEEGCRGYSATLALTLIGWQFRITASSPSRMTGSRFAGETRLIKTGNDSHFAC